MRHRRIQEGPAVYALAFEAGEEAVEALAGFARERKIAGGHFSGIGGFRVATLGYFDIALKQYRRIHVREQVEVMSFLGNLSTYDGELRVHAHVVLGKADGSAIGGHLISGEVRPTLELMVTETAALEREMDEVSGLPRLKP
jgi:predicted DNA-binding protein with PD1-like motif